MEAKINIVEKLKDKPQGTKLYSLTYGDCFYQEYTGDFGIECQSQNGVQFNLDEYGKYCIDGECVVFPSKEMRDWSKFFKKGDVLVSNDSDSHIIFKGFSKNDYTTFEGKHWISVSKKRYVSCLDIQNVQDYHIEDNKDAAQTYINTIEKRLDGKLNRKTLEIEKTQPEFKDGDFVYYTSLDGDKCIGIVKETKNDAIMFHVDYNLGTHSMDFNVSILKENFEFYKSNDLDDEIALNEALYIRYKSWNKEKNILEELKPKVDLKPFDKVLVRDCKSDNWRANLFGYIGKDGYYRCVWANWAYCIPYAGNESLLGTAKDVED